MLEFFREDPKKPESNNKLREAFSSLRKGIDVVGSLLDRGEMLAGMTFDRFQKLNPENKLWLITGQKKAEFGQKLVMDFGGNKELVRNVTLAHLIPDREFVKSKGVVYKNNGEGDFYNGSKRLAIYEGTDVEIVDGTGMVVKKEKVDKSPVKKPVEKPSIIKPYVDATKEYIDQIGFKPVAESLRRYSHAPENFDEIMGADVNEPFQEFTMFDPYRNAEHTVKLRATVVKILSQMQEELHAKGYHLVVFSGHRTEDRQKKLKAENSDPKWVAQHMSNHLSGGTVDVQLFKKDKKGRWVAVTPRGKDEQLAGRGIQKEIQMLEEEMNKRGFALYTNESWHFEFKSPQALAALQKAGYFAPDEDISQYAYGYEKGKPLVQDHHHEHFVDSVPKSLREAVDKVNFEGEVKVVELPGNKGRPVVLFVPKDIDFSKAEMVVHFHGTKGHEIGKNPTAYERFNSFAKTMNGGQAIGVYPLSGGYEGKVDINSESAAARNDYANNWMDGKTNGNMQQLYANVLEVLQSEHSGLKLTKVTVQGHSAGGRALQHLARYFDPGRDVKYEMKFLDSSYGNWASSAYASLMELRPDAKLNIYRIEGSDTDTDFVKGLKGQPGVRIQDVRTDHGGVIEEVRHGVV